MSTWSQSMARRLECSLESRPLRIGLSWLSLWPQRSRRSKRGRLFTAISGTRISWLTTNTARESDLSILAMLTLDMSLLRNAPMNVQMNLSHLKYGKDRAGHRDGQIFTPWEAFFITWRRASA